MTRSERPQVKHRFRVDELSVDVPASEDVVEFAQLRSFGEEIGAPIDIEYWKSIPYFANFMDGYKPGEKARAKFGTPDGHRAEEILASTRSMRLADLEEFHEVESANGYLRALKPKPSTSVGGRCSGCHRPCRTSSTGRSTPSSTK